MKIGFDVMGGDYAPETALEGVILALQELSPDIELVLIGNRSMIQENYPEELKKILNYNNISFVNATEVITMSDSPTKAFSEKPDSSMAVGFGLLSKGEIDVFLSAGNTGAMLVGALYSVKAIEGILRPTILSLLPKLNGNYGIILDVGLNSDTREDVLLQFGVLGSLYMKSMFHMKNPKVGLFNIGSEREKGNIVTKAAYPLLEASSQINFIGNVEGYDLFSDMADVIVCDGFAGNLILKSIEGIYNIHKLKGIQDEFFNRFDYQDYGGTPILGINKPVLVGHGSSTGKAFKSMILLGKSVVENNLVDDIKKLFRSQNNINA
jgi:glycerol-3-phosphate acyltransferase PlsX